MAIYLVRLADVMGIDLGRAIAREIAFGPAHDRLDAYLSAWVTALDEDDRVAFGDAPDDVIWVPIVGLAKSLAQPPSLTNVSAVWYGSEVAEPSKRE